MSIPKIQIIIPLYNGEKYIQKCLESVLNQSFKDWQAIIIDDASTDSGVKIVREYAVRDNRFVCICKEQNYGVSHTRNMGLDMLTAEYVAFLDSDDYWEEDMLETLVNCAKAYSCDVVQSRFIYNYPGGKTKLPKGAFKKDTLLTGKDIRKVYMKMMTGINMNHVCMKLIKAELLKDIRFDSSLKTAEDLKVCAQMFKNVKRYYFADKVLYHYCRNEESLTGNGLSGKEKLKANRAVSKEIANSLQYVGMDNVFYKALAYLRPYTIICSKLWRILCEKLLSKK